MFTDVAVFVNPDDKRYEDFLGKKVINPINGELLPIMEDRGIDINFGTGAMKCTPAHDFFDYDLAKRYNIKDFQSCIALDGKLNEHAKNQFMNFVGVDRIEARKAIVENIKERGLLEKIEDVVNNVGYSERTGVVVEPLLSLQ
jgi:valyl-tRNA synthetase